MIDNSGKFTTSTHKMNKMNKMYQIANKMINFYVIIQVINVIDSMIFLGTTLEAIAIALTIHEVFLFVTIHRTVANQEIIIDVVVMIVNLDGCDSNVELMNKFYSIANGIYNFNGYLTIINVIMINSIKYLIQTFNLQLIVKDGNKTNCNWITYISIEF